MRHVLLGWWADTKKAANPTGFTAVTGGLNSTTLTWVNPNGSLYDGVSIYRSINGSGYTLIANPAKGDVVYHDAPGYSIDATYIILAYKAGWNNGDQFVSASCRLLPNVPSPQNLIAYNGGLIDFYSNLPGHGNITGQDAEISVDNGASWSGVYDIAFANYIRWPGIAHNAQVRARARTRDGFGQVSDWVQWVTYVVAVNDLAGPPAPTPTNVSWVSAGAGQGGFMLIRWVAHPDALSANGPTYVQASYGGGAWVTVQTMSPGGAAYNSAIAFPLANRGQSVSYRLVTTDVWGNQTIGAGSALAWSRPYGNVTVLATGVDYYTDTIGWRGGFIPYADNFAPSSRGIWFYGTQLFDACHGFVPDAAYVMLIKNGSNPAEAGTHDVQLCQNDSFYDGITAPIMVGGVLAGPYMDTDGQYAVWPIPFAFYQPMVVGSVRGLGLVSAPGAAAPRRLYGTNANSTSGQITFAYTA